MDEPSTCHEYPECGWWVGGRGRRERACGPGRQHDTTAPAHVSTVWPARGAAPPPPSPDPPYVTITRANHPHPLLLTFLPSTVPFLTRHRNRTLPSLLPSSFPLPSTSLSSHLTALSSFSSLPSPSLSPLSSPLNAFSSFSFHSPFSLIPPLTSLSSFSSPSPLSLTCLFHTPQDPSLSPPSLTRFPDIVT